MQTPPINPKTVTIIMPSSFFHQTNSTMMTAAGTTKLRDPPDSSQPTSPRHASAHHFSSRTLKSLFTTKRSPGERAASVVTSSSVFSNAGVDINEGQETQGRMRDRLTLMGTGKRRSEPQVTVRFGNGTSNDATVKQREGRATDGKAGGSRLMQGTVASRSKAANVCSDPPPATSTGTVRFPTTVSKNNEIKIVSTSSTCDSEKLASSGALAHDAVPLRKKKNSLSLFLSSSKARASVSSSPTGSTKASAASDQARGHDDTLKARVVSNPAGNKPYVDRIRGEVKRSQTIVKKRTPVERQPANAEGEVLKQPTAYPPSSPLPNVAIDDLLQPTSPPTTRFTREAPRDSLHMSRPQTTRRLSPRAQPNGSGTVSPRGESIPTTGTSTVRAQSPISVDNQPQGSRLGAGDLVGPDDGNHFVLRLAVTYLSKTILPELRSSRHDSRDRAISSNASSEVFKQRKGLIELLRPLERMERSWGIDWMLKGKEGFKVSFRTKEKERDGFRIAIADGKLLMYLADKLMIDAFRTAKARFDAIIVSCQALQLSFEGNVRLENIASMEGIAVYTAASIIVALARHAGPHSKLAGSGEEDEGIRSRSPSPELVTDRSMRKMQIKRQSEPVATIKLVDNSTKATPDRLSLNDRHTARRTYQASGMAIRLPAGNYYASNPMHSKLDTVLSMTPGEGGMTPGMPTSEPSEGHYFGLHAHQRSTSPSETILQTPRQSQEDEHKPLSQADSSVPFRYHSRDPTPSLVSGTTDRTSMALTDPPEKAIRSISFASQDGEPRRRFKTSLQNHVDIVGAFSDQIDLPDVMSGPPTPVSLTGARFRPRVQRGVTMASSISSIDAVERTPSRRNSEIKPGRPQYIPRRHTTQAPPAGANPRGGEGRPQGMNRVSSGSAGQPYSPPATPRRAMSPSFSESPYLPSSRRTSFTSATSQSPAGRESVKPFVVVKDIEGKIQTYQLGNCIGKGQFGIVYRALNLNNGQFVAVKRITLENLDEDIDTIMREVEVLKRLKHPSIVRYLGMAKDDRFLDIILEYVEGGSLANASRSFGKFSEHLVACYAAKMLEGLHYLHGQDVVHCDLKAANILITKKADVRLTDFGVSLNLRAMENQKDDNVVGTPNWVAPEIISLQGASKASDIWSLGCTIVELLEGKPPWSELDSNMAVLFKIVEEEWPIPEHYSDELQKFLRLCFQKDPSERPTAETLFDHNWIREEIGLDPRLRSHDSIPFLRRISGDAVRLQQLRFDAGPSASFSHLRDVSSPIEGSFRDWKVDRPRPVLTEMAYTTPERPGLRSDAGSAFSVRSENTDPGQARHPDLIEAERQRALAKLTNVTAPYTPGMPNVTPILQVHYPTRAKERLERLRETESRRESEETVSASRSSGIRSSRDFRAEALDSIHQTITNHESNKRSRESSQTILASASQRDHQEYQERTMRAKPSQAHMPLFDSPPAKSSIPVSSAGSPIHERADNKGECTLQ